jgi:hypothetical protein
VISTDGDGADAALADLVALVEGGIGEGDAEEPSP